MIKDSPHELTEHFFRRNYTKMVALLVRYFGLNEVEIAEDIVQDTLVEAMEKWSIQPIPHHPEAWLMDVAKKKTINFLRRHQNFENKIGPNWQKKLSELSQLKDRDDTLRMIFACCHPSLPAESQIAMALKTLCGLSVGEIAAALLTTESNVNKRLYRAKQKFRLKAIPFIIPQDQALPNRLKNVFTTLYLLFNEGYYSPHRERVIRMDLCLEAIRLIKEIIEFYPNSTQAKALLALMYLSVARFDSRIDKQGVLVILSEQNRKAWDGELIAQGIEFLHQASTGKELSVYHLQAGIAAEHCIAESFESTRWESIYQQYTLLEKLQPSGMVSFNKTIAKFYGIDQQEALTDLQALADNPALKSNALYHSTLGIFFSEMGQKDEGLAHFKAALSLSSSTVEKARIEQRMNG